MANIYQTAAQTCHVKSDNYATTIASRLYEHLVKGSLGDCLLSAEGKFIRAHKLILSISSEYFENMFSVNGLEKPVIIMPLGLKFNDLCLILDFAYLGQAQVPHDSLDDFLKAGELLQIRGIKERRLNFMTTQQTTMNRSFDSTISSTQETFTPQPPTKRPRDDDEISIQEASEIMKMLLESNPELEGEIQEKTLVNLSSQTLMPNSTNFLPKTPMMQAPQINFFARPPIPPTPSKKKTPVVKNQDKQKFPCRFCHRPLASKGRVTKHENECNGNPDREVANCDVCNVEIKPSAMTLHKNSKHGASKFPTTTPDNSNQLPIISSSPSPRTCCSPGLINSTPSPLPSPVDSLSTLPTENVVAFVNASPTQLIKMEKLDVKRDDETMEVTP